MESKYLCDIMSDLFNDAFKFTQKFFNALNTNLLSWSKELSQTLGGFAVNLNEKM